MARHEFTLAEQLRALERAIKSPTTPNQLKKSLRRRRSHLKTEMTKQRLRGGFLGFLGIGRRQK